MRLIEKFKKQHAIIQILDIAFIISFIYEIITLRTLQLTLWIAGILVLIRCYEEFFKKES